VTINLENIYEAIDSKHVSNGELAGMIYEDKGSLEAAVDGLFDHNMRIRVECAKALRILSRNNCPALYPYFNSFAELLDSAKPPLVEEIMYIVANLASVDNQNKIDALLDVFFEPLEGESLHTTRAAIVGALRIAAAKPQLAKRIREQLLRVENGSYTDERARTLARDAAFDALDKLNAMHL